MSDLSTLPTFHPPSLRAHQAAQIWTALQAKEAVGLAAGLADILTPRERQLYELLTARLIHEVNVLGIIETSGDPTPTPNPPPTR